MVLSSLTLPAAFPALHQRQRRTIGPPVEDHPKVDKKAYKAALERIPEPDKKYDPWGIARPAEPAKPGKKSN